MTKGECQEGYKHKTRWWCCQRTLQGRSIRVPWWDIALLSFSPMASLQSVQSLSRVRLFMTPWVAACQASLSITNSWNLLKLMSIVLVMPSNHLIPFCPLLLLPSIVPNIKWELTQKKLLEYKTQHNPTTSSTLCRTPHISNEQKKIKTPIISRKVYHLTQPFPSKEKQRNKSSAQSHPVQSLHKPLDKP